MTGSVHLYADIEICPIAANTLNDIQQELVSAILEDAVLFIVHRSLASC